MDMTRALTIPEVAKHLQASPGVVRNLIRSGRLRAINISEGLSRAHYRVWPKDLQEFMYKS